MLTRTEKTVVSRNYLLRTCSECKQELEITEGDVIFDGKWYHKHCWSAFLDDKIR